MARRTAPDRTHCPGCRAPILTQLVGNRAALNVTADLRRLTPEQQAEARTPHRLIWCLKTRGPHSTPRLRWIDRWHPPDCPHPHVTEHHCNPEPNTLF
ncbi:hypothetical protein [Streptomyces sp. NPDC102437]|uniref:hypothetical protein n=1 Tax=Streptomyces sp. NPDC102437 TaxID=3366175 RepID=UPI0038103F01